MGCCGVDDGTLPSVLPYTEGDTLPRIYGRYTDVANATDFVDYTFVLNFQQPDGTVISIEGDIDDVDTGDFSFPPFGADDLVAGILNASIVMTDNDGEIQTVQNFFLNVAHQIVPTEP